MSLYDIAGKEVFPGDVIVYAMDRGILGQGVVQAIVPETEESPPKISVVKPHYSTWFTARLLDDPIKTTTITLHSTGHSYVTGETLEDFWKRVKIYATERVNANPYALNRE